MKRETEDSILTKGSGATGKMNQKHRMAGGVGKDRERAGNRLVQKLKQTYKLTGFIPPFHSVKRRKEREEDGGGGGGLIKSMPLPSHV